MRVKLLPGINALFVRDFRMQNSSTIPTVNTPLDLEGIGLIKLHFIQNWVLSARKPIA